MSGLPVVTVTGVVSIPRVLVSCDELAEDRARLSVDNPAYHQAVRLGSPHAWRLPRTVSALDEDPTHLHYPLGARTIIAERLRGKGFELDDQRPTFESKPFACSTVMRPDQEVLVGALLGGRCGVAVAPCGAGKGETLVAMTARLGVPTLIVVGQTDQARELCSRFERRAGIAVGMIGGGRFDVRDVTVALVQSLTAERLEALKVRFGAVIVDEVHHASAASYVRVLRTLLVQRRYGLTATPRTDGLWPIVLAWVGPIVHTTTRADLVDAGASVLPRYKVVETAFAGEYEDSDDWAPLLEELVEDDGRNQLIVDTAAAHCKTELGAVLTGRVAHAERLAYLARQRGMRAYALTGCVRAGERSRILQAAREGHVDLITATQLFDEGIDVPRLSRVFLVFPSKAEPRFVQRVGRALRPHAEKAVPVVFDFHDVRVGVLRHQGSKRAATFARAFGGPARRAA